MEIQIQFLFMLFTLSVVLSRDKTDKYCAIATCLPGDHTMCLYSKEGSHKRCGRVIRSGLSEKERIRILETHNDFRTRVFSGQEERGNPGPQPPAARVVPLEWNVELATIAQSWSDQCRNASDTCRDIDKFRVGQNIALSEYDENISEDLELLYLQWLVGSWYDEVEKFDRNQVQDFRKSRAGKTVTYHYTQIVWEKSTQIGCGVTRYVKAEDVKILFVCNYGPNGNVDREKVYRTQEDVEN